MNRCEVEAKINLDDSFEEEFLEDSVKLEAPNKQIVCTLPLRGKKRRFSVE